MTVSLLYYHHNRIALAMFGGERIGSSHQFNTHTRSTSYKYKALDILYMRWGSHMSVSLLHYHHKDFLAKFGVR